MRLFGLALALSPAVLVAQQSLERLVASAPDGTVQFAFAARAGICGDGRGFIADASLGTAHYRTWVFRDDVNPLQGSPDWQALCLAGPAWVLLSKTGARIHRLDVFAGPELRVVARGTDLGRVGSAEAARWLVNLAESSTVDEVVSRAFFAATLADSARLTDRLIAIARNRERRAYPRERAVRWLPEVSEREGSGPAADAAMRAIAADETDTRTVRERAIRELRHTQDNDGFLRRSYGSITDYALKERILRRLGESWSDENTAWIRGVAVNRREPLSLRERALRVLGEEIRQRDQLTALYAELEEVSLKERVVRMAGEHGDSESLRWLRTVATDRNEHGSLRERALRVLGEQGESAYLRELYPRLESVHLKERVMRVLTEHQGGDLEWLRQRALDAAEDPGLRDRAVRLFAEHGGSTEALIGLYDTSRTRPLQERVVRLLAERGDDHAVDKLISIARSDPDSDLRRLALRRLAESGHPKARSFLQETVRR